MQAVAEVVNGKVISSYKLQSKCLLIHYAKTKVSKMGHVDKCVHKQISGAPFTNMA